MSSKKRKSLDQDESDCEDDLTNRPKKQAPLIRLPSVRQSVMKFVEAFIKENCTVWDPKEGDLAFAKLMQHKRMLRTKLREMLSKQTGSIKLTRLPLKSFSTALKRYWMERGASFQQVRRMTDHDEECGQEYYLGLCLKGTSQHTKTKAQAEEKEDKQTQVQNRQSEHFQPPYHLTQCTDAEDPNRSIYLLCIQLTGLEPLDDDQTLFNKIQIDTLTRTIAMDDTPFRVREDSLELVCDKLRLNRPVSKKRAQSFLTLHFHISLPDDVNLSETPKVVRTASHLVITLPKLKGKHIKPEPVSLDADADEIALHKVFLAQRRGKAEL